MSNSERAHELTAKLLNDELKWQSLIRVGDLVDNMYDDRYFTTSGERYLTKGKLYEVKTVAADSLMGRYAVVTSDIVGHDTWIDFSSLIIRDNQIVWYWGEEILTRYKEASREDS